MSITNENHMTIEIIKPHAVESLFLLSPKVIILFGSYANRTFSSNSDIDIAFLANRDITQLQRWEIQEDLATKLGIDVDLVDMSTSNDVINFQIVSNGIILYEDGTVFAQNFLDLVYSKYLQLNEDRKEILKYASR